MKLIPCFVVGSASARNRCPLTPHAHRGRAWHILSNRSSHQLASPNPANHPIDFGLHSLDLTGCDRALRFSAPPPRLPALSNPARNRRGQRPKPQPAGTRPRPHVVSYQRAARKRYEPSLSHATKHQSNRGVSSGPSLYIKRETATRVVTPRTTQQPSRHEAEGRATHAQKKKKSLLSDARRSRRHGRREQPPGWRRRRQARASPQVAHVTVLAPVAHPGRRRQAAPAHPAVHARQPVAVV